MKSSIKKNVLYVDDQIENLMLFQELFSEKFNVICLSEPTEAIDYAKNNVIHIVISDYKMPIMNGVELLEVFKNEFPHIIRIMITANLDANVEILARAKCNLFAFLTKPFNKSKIEKTIENALNCKFQAQL